MSAKQGIWVDGERELFLNMQKTLDGSIRAGMQGLERAAMNIIADAKVNLRSNESVVTGQLRASGRVQRAQDEEQALDAGFFGQESGGYATFVEYGRRSGKMPPVDFIVQWVRKKLRLPDKEARSVGFLIARKIARKGTRPHPFLGPAVEKNQNKVTQAISEAIKNAIK